jgi:hypothetical protein
MARRKHHKKHTSRRRRHHSMSGVKGMASNALAIIAGGVAGRFVGNFVGSTFASTSSYKGYIQAGVPIALGFLTPKLVKSEFGKGLGAGMIAVGGLSLFQTLGVVSGVPMIAGYGGKKVGLGPTNQNPRGSVAGLSTHQAAILTA